MKRTAGVALLVLLLALAFIIHRSPKPEAPRPAAVVEGPPPEPEAIAVEPKPPPAPPPLPPRRAAPAPTQMLPRLLNLPGTAVLRGAVKVLGEPPRQKTIKTDSDPKCAAMHPEPILSDAQIYLLASLLGPFELTTGQVITRFEDNEPAAVRRAHHPVLREQSQSAAYR